MVERFKNKCRFYGVVGLLFHALAWALHFPVVSWLIAVFGSFLLMLSVAYFARSRGRAAVWGVLGFFSLPTMLPGLALLAILPDRSKGRA